MNDDIGDRIKDYEADYDQRLMPMVPAIARLDGRSFHNYTRRMERPFDRNMIQTMILLTEYLVDETGAVIGYTQSDEITLVWHAANFKSKIFFNGRVNKINSVLAATASVRFNALAEIHLPEHQARAKMALIDPVFDCRVFSVPSRTEAANVLLWREMDATKNAITMAASHYYSHKQLHGKNGTEKQEMLHAKGVNFNNYPASFKRGTYVQRVTISKPFTADELAKLPPKHQAHKNPGLVVERSKILQLSLPKLTSIKNREAVIFDGAAPSTT
jgi:tRNA(His) 5'-end guanylyltransferase